MGYPTPESSRSWRVAPSTPTALLNRTRKARQPHCDVVVVREPYVVDLAVQVVVDNDVCVVEDGAKEGLSEWSPSLMNVDGKDSACPTQLLTAGSDLCHRLGSGSGAMSLAIY